MKKTFFVPHLGLGDHFTCNGMTRELYKECDLMVMPVKENNIKVVRRMFKDLINLHLLPLVGSMDYSDTQHMNDAFALMEFFKARGYDIKAVGAFSPSTFIRGDKKYDEVFYEQVGVPFEKRWSSFYYERNKDNERILYNKFFKGYAPWDLEGSPTKDLPNTNYDGYVFLHDDPDRGRVINRDILPKDIKVITPHKKFWDADILDYRGVLEYATEIHCVNSSFADLMDAFDLSRVKRICLHEYARQGDPVNYKNNFEIIKNYE